MNSLYLIIGLLVVFIIYLVCKQNQGLKIVFCVAISLVLGVGTYYSGVQINKYYSASGGIFGQISGIFNTNKAEQIDDDLSFKIYNIEMKKVDEYEYVAKVVIDKGFKLSSKNHCVYVNNIPCLNREINQPNVISADYTYNFYSENQELILSDALNLKFAFDENSTTLLISTKGGSTAVKYWNYFFNKNSIIVSIEEIKNEEEVTPEIKDIVLKENQRLATFYIEENLIGFQVVNTGSKLKEINLNAPTNIQINGWKVNNETVDISNYTVTQNVSFEADYIELMYLELRTGRPNEYEILDTGYYTAGTTFLDCLGYNLPYSVMSNLLIEMYDGNYTMETIGFDKNVEEIAGGVVYLNNIEIMQYPGEFSSHRFDSSTKSYVINNASVSDVVDLNLIKNVGFDRIEISYPTENREIILSQKDFVKSENIYTYQGNKIWTTTSGGKVEEDFSLSYNIDMNLNLTLTASNNFITSIPPTSDDYFGTVKPEYKFKLSILRIEFLPSIFYLV